MNGATSGRRHGDVPDTVAPSLISSPPQHFHRAVRPPFRLETLRQTHSAPYQLFPWQAWLDPPR